MYKNRTIVGSLIALVITILFVIAFALVRSRADESDYNSFEAVTGLAGLIVAIVSAIYVYNAYTTQKELIAIQKKEIEDNRKELEKSRQDAEFTRTLDVLYRQFEFTNQKHLNANNSSESPVQYHDLLKSGLNSVNNSWHQATPSGLKSLLNLGFHFSQIVRKDLFIYEMIVFSNTLPKENVSIMISMVRKNYMSHINDFFELLNDIDVFIKDIDQESLRNLLDKKKLTFDDSWKNLTDLKDNIEFINGVLDEYLTQSDIEDIRRELYD